MKIIHGKFDPETRTIDVTFKEGKIAHKRTVNAALKEDGSYDREATKEIIAQQARGLAEKIKVGVIR